MWAGNQLLPDAFSFFFCLFLIGFRVLLILRLFQECFCLRASTLTLSLVHGAISQLSTGPAVYHISPRSLFSLHRLSQAFSAQFFFSIEVPLSMPPPNQQHQPAPMSPNPLYSSCPLLASNTQVCTCVLSTQSKPGTQRRAVMICG